MRPANRKQKAFRPGGNSPSPRHLTLAGLLCNIPGLYNGLFEIAIFSFPGSPRFILVPGEKGLYYKAIDRFGGRYEDRDGG